MVERVRRREAGDSLKGVPAARRWRAAFEYGVAVAVIAAVVVLRERAGPALGSRIPFAPFGLVLLLLAWWCRPGATALAAVTGYLAAVWLFVPPRGTLLIADPVDRWLAALHAGIMGCIVVGGALLHRARRSAATGRRAVFAEAEGLEPDARYRAIFERATVGIAEVDASGAFLLANERLCRIAGRPRCEIDAVRLSDLIDSADRDRVLSMLAAVSRGERREAIVETRLVRPGGHAVGVQIDAAAPGGAPRGALVLVVQDLTDRDRAEASRGRALERLELALEHTGTWAWEVDRESGRVQCTPAAERVFGFTAGTITEFGGAVHADDRAAVTAAFNAAARDGKAYRVEHRVVHRDGSVRWIVASGRAVRDARTGADRVYGVSEDVTQRRAAQAEFGHARSMLEKIAATIPDLLYVHDIAARRNVYMNPSVHGRLGYTPEQLQGFGERLDERLVHPDDLTAAREGERRLLTLADGEVMERRFRVRHAEGGYRWMQALDTPFERDESGRVRRVLGLARDVTDQVLAERKLEEQAARLRRVGAELEDFAHVAAHDLKEPLRGIRTWSHFLMEDIGATLKPVDRDRLLAIDRLAARAHTMLDGLLEHARLARAEPARQVVRFATLAHAAASRVRDVAEARRGQVRVAPAEAVLDCDPALAERLLVALVRNGLVFNSSAVPMVAIGVRTGPGVPAVEVRDNGLGIPPVHHERVFRLFKRLHTRDEFGGGSGAGLAMAKRIVEAHGGRIWIESDGAAGTSVVFTLQPGEPAEPERPDVVVNGSCEAAERLGQMV